MASTLNCLGRGWGESLCHGDGLNFTLGIFNKPVYLYGAVCHEHTMQMVDFMLENTRQPIIDFITYLIAMPILRTHNKLCGTIYIRRQTWHTETTFLGNLRTFCLEDLWVD